MATNVAVTPVAGKADTELFLRLPWRLYKDDPAWVPNLLILQRELIDRKKNPFFDHGEAELFLARRGGEVVGRISAQIDRDHNKQHDERTGFFGFYESIDDAAVTAALFETAEGWLRARGMETARGPFSFSINEDVGLLIDGYEYPPMISMTHALPYYSALVEGQGYAKAMDLLAYRWQITKPPARMMEAVERMRSVPGLKLRKIDMHHLHRDVEILLDIYNDAWSQNWGYVQVTPREARKLADDLRLIADNKLGLIAEMNGEPAGMIVGLPNLYETIRDFKGFIDPWKAVKLLWRLKVRGPETGRVILFGVKKKFRNRELYGMPFQLLHELYLGSQQGRYQWCETSWVLENNARLNALMSYWDTPIYKRYRIYEKAL